jgi:hypothetical protein
MNKQCSNKLQWDGTALEGFNKSMFIIQFPSPNNKAINYCKLKYNNKIICCRYEKMKDISPCIYDEFMQLFNMRKNGTHYALIKKYYYIFTKINYDYNLDKIKEDKILSSMDYDKKNSLMEYIKEDIRKIYMLHDLLGIHTYDGYISIRNIKNVDRAIAHRLPVIYHDMYTNSESTIGNNALESWFDGDEDFTQTILNICPIDDDSYLPYISNIKEKMEIIVKRIDKHYIYMVSMIISRMRDRLEVTIG